MAKGGKRKLKSTSAANIWAITLITIGLLLVGAGLVTAIVIAVKKDNLERKQEQKKISDSK